VVFDDADWPSIRRVIRFVLTNPSSACIKGCQPKSFNSRRSATMVCDGSDPNGFRKLPGLGNRSREHLQSCWVSTKIWLEGSLIASKRE
jgi:hypothetical protein